MACHFGRNVSTTERLVTCLRETGRVADRPRSGRPRVTMLSVSRTCAIVTNYDRNCPNYRWHSLSPRSTRNSEKSIACSWYSDMPTIYFSTPDPGTSLASYCVVDSICTKNIFDKAMGTGPFTNEFRFTLFRPDGLRHINGRRRESSPTLALLRGIDFGAWSGETFLMMLNHS